MAASLEHDTEMEKMGIKAQKADGTPFTQEEKVALRKKFIQYETGALKVSQSTLTPEAIQNNNVFVEVEFAEIENKKIKTCYCDKNLTEDEVKDIIKTIKESETIFNHKDCTIKDKTIKSFTLELNKVFTKYNINKCIQKITFLAQAFHESDNFNTAEEYPSKFNSSKSRYKGRGLIQMTGEKAKGSELYNEAGPYEKYANYKNKKNKKEIINEPKLIAEELRYAVDSAGWLWSKFKKTPNWTKTSKKEAIIWKADYFKDGIGKSLNELAIVMENVDEEKYFYLQSKLLNGYSPDHKLEEDPKGWSNRQSTFSKLKTWFKYNKNVCNGEVELNLSGRAPWMKYAVQELKTYGGKRMHLTPLKERVYEYHDLSSPPGGTNLTPWCASFVNWCFEQTIDFKGTNKVTNVGAFDWLPKLQAKAKRNDIDGWENGEIITNIDDVFYGAVIVFSHSHVAFIVGESTNGKDFIYLGGNQSDGKSGDGENKRTICTNPKSKSDINSSFWIIKPKGYLPSALEKKLPAVSPDGKELDYDTTH